MKLQQLRSGQCVLTVPVTVTVSEQTATALKITDCLSRTTRQTRQFLIEKALSHSEDTLVLIAGLRADLEDALAGVNKLLR